MSAPPDDRGPSLSARIAALRPAAPRGTAWLAAALLAPPLATIAAATLMTGRAEPTVPAPDARVAALTRPTISATLAGLATLLPADATLHAVDATGPHLAIEVETADPAALRAALSATPAGRRFRTAAQAPGIAGVRVRLEAVR